MTNKELQDLLKQYPDDAEVCFIGEYTIEPTPVRYAEYDSEWKSVMLDT